MIQISYQVTSNQWFLVTGNHILSTVEMVFCYIFVCVRLRKYCELILPENAFPLLFRDEEREY